MNDFIKLDQQLNIKGGTPYIHNFYHEKKRFDIFILLVSCGNLKNGLIFKKNTFALTQYQNLKNLGFEISAFSFEIPRYFIKKNYFDRFTLQAMAACMSQNKDCKIFQCNIYYLFKPNKNVSSIKELNIIDDVLYKFYGVIEKRFLNEFLKNNSLYFFIRVNNYCS